MGLLSNILKGSSAPVAAYEFDGVEATTTRSPEDDDDDDDNDGRHSDVHGWVELRALSAVVSLSAYAAERQRVELQLRELSGRHVSHDGYKSLYTSENQRVRKKLRNDPAITEQLQILWSVYELGGGDGAAPHPKKKNAPQKLTTHIDEASDTRAVFTCLCQWVWVGCAPRHALM